jgi:replicative DNA helicase
MIHKARTSRRGFLASSAASAAGALLAQEEAQGTNEKPQPCALTGLPTGFEEIDRLTGGLNPRELVLLASRPGVGKTALALNFTDSVSVEASIPTLYVTLDPARLEIARRLMCSRGQVCHAALRHRALPTDVGRRLTQAGAELAQAPIYIDDQPLRTAAKIRTVAQRLNQRLAPHAALGLVVVDHLQRVEAEYRGQPESTHLVDLAYQLRDIAAEMDLAVLCLLRLNCRPPIGHHSRPTLGELRGTQHAADVVMLLHRPGSHLAPSDAQQDGPESEAQLSVIRRRHLLAKELKLSWNSQYTRFSDHAARL